MSHFDYAPDRAPRGGTRVAVAALLLIMAGVLAALVGSALAPSRAHAPPPAMPILGAGAIQLPFDTGWERVPPPAPWRLPGLKVLGTLEEPGVTPNTILARVTGPLSPNGLPASLVARPGTPQRVRLGSGVARRYAVTIPFRPPAAGSALVAQAGKTTAVVLCLAAQASQQQTDCEALSLALRVRDATPHDPDPAYAGALATAIRTLDGSIPAAERRLAGAHRPPAVAAAATAVARQWSEIANRLRALPPTRGSQAPTGRLIARAGAVSSQARALAVAAGRHDRAGVARAAARARAAERAFAAGLLALRTLGYRVG